MKNSKKMTEVYFWMSLISFIVYIITYFCDEIIIPILFLNEHIYYVILPQKVQDCILNISLGIFGGAIVGFLITLREYKNNKNQWLIKYLDTIYQFRILFDKIPILYKENFKGVEFFKEEYSINSDGLLSMREKVNTSLKEYQKLENYKKYYIMKQAKIENKNLMKALNECIDNIEFFDMKKTVEIRNIYQYIKRINDELDTAVKWSFTHNIPWMEIDKIIDIQNLLTQKEQVKKYELKRIIYYNTFQQNIDKIFDRLSYLNYGKVEHKHAKEKDWYILEDPYFYQNEEIKIKQYNIKKMIEALSEKIESMRKDKQLVCLGDLYVQDANGYLIRTCGTIKEINNESEYISLTTDEDGKFDQYLKLFWNNLEKTNVKKGDFIEAIYKLETCNPFNNYEGKLVSFQKL